MRHQQDLSRFFRTLGCGGNVNHTDHRKSPKWISDKCAVSWNEFDLQPTCTLKQMYNRSAFRLRWDFAMPGKTRGWQSDWLWLVELFSEDENAFQWCFLWSGSIVSPSEVQQSKTPSPPSLGMGPTHVMWWRCPTSSYICSNNHSKKAHFFPCTCRWGFLWTVHEFKCWKWSGALICQLR